MTTVGENDEDEAPLTLQHLQSAIECQGKSVQKINQSNARDVCSFVKTLNLQFQGIGSLHIAWLLTNLQELYLNNNILKTTRGLEALTNLRWLDLSFNKIKSIEGLQSLTSLEVLTLHENCLENLEDAVLTNLKKLEVLTLGNNNIQNTEDVLILRRLPKLGSLTLKNNPCSSDGYPYYVIAHLPHLVYLDYERITKEQQEEANEKHRDSLDQVQMNDQNILKEATATKQKEEEESLHKMAGVYALNDDSLFRALFEGDVEMEAMILQHGVQTIIDRFREQFKGICIHVFDAGLLHAEQRKKELAQVQSALENARHQSDILARKLAASLDADMSVLLEKAKEITKDDEVAAVIENQELYDERDKKVTELRELVEDTLDNALTRLMENEVSLANQVKEILELSEEELGTMVFTFLSDAAGYFEEGRGFAYSFYCRLREITTKLVEASVAVKQRQSDSAEVGSKDEEEEEQTLSTDKSEEEERRESHNSNIFEGSDTLTAALARIHDRHLETINLREEELKNHLNSWLRETLDDFYRLEWKRHRSRLEEITTLSEEKRKDIDTYLPLDVFVIE